MTASTRRFASLLGASLALLVPILALATLEGVLRIGGYGSDYPLFVASPDDADYLMPNPAIVERYFPARMAPALAISPNYFLREKPPAGIRIFVQGASTAAGFPYERGASPATLLGYRLARSFPERRVEVVDTAMAAVSSHVLLDFVDEIVAQQPDAVLIYAGHNEYVGLLGVGSVARGAATPALTRLTLRLQRFRAYQLARNVFGRARSAIFPPPPLAGTTLMAELASAQHVPFDSDTFRRGLAQWRENLSAMVERYETAGVPVFVATVTSNLKDQAPFASAPVSSAPAPTSTSASAPDSAENYFAQAAMHEERGEIEEARRLYTLARDHDLLRFRAPTGINETTAEIARTTAAELVDVAAVFEAASPQGLVGDELLLEHVHPNLAGYFLLADAFYRALAEGGIPAPFPETIPTEIAREEIGAFPAEIWFAEAAVAELKSDFPFLTEKRAPVLPPVQTAADALGRAWFDNEIDWLEMAEASRELVADLPLPRALASQRIADALPFRRDLADRAAADWLAAGRPADAARYARVR